MLGSLIANSLCADALVVVFVFDESARMRQIISKHGAHSIRCRARHTMNCSIKSILYSVARMIRADYFLCLDADVLVCGDLRRLIATLEVLPPGSVLIARDAMPLADLGAALKNLYGGEPADLERITGEKIGSELEFPLVVNDGVFCASRPALNAIDDAIREMTGAAQWLRENPSIPWRNQFVFNLALARLNCGVEMDAMFNVQLNHRHIEFSIDRGRMSCRDNSRIAKIVHFNGAGRNKYADLRGRYQTNGGSHCGTTDGDSYGVFASALRRWVGYGGVDRLAWSFYGTADGRSARIADPTTFPLLALLHYLVRANGCVRVLETGTARGVSAACLASAVCHREGGKIVTLDPTHWPDRDQLWSQLPESMSRTIEPRLADSISGLQSAAAAGEAYDAALLDSIHSCEHVMKEFDLATRLVCTGGLILIHDATWKNGTVADALQRIQDRGYGVARLWTAESGIHEDDRLGLAVVENRLADASTKANSQFEAW
jgi:predicted O-methyltransferase YrrM